jgi:PAS domain S-box-containing protein
MNTDNLPFDLIVEQLHDGVLVVSFAGKIIYVNHQMSNILGYTMEEMYGKQLFDFMSEEWAHRAKENLKRRAAGVEERFDHQFLHKRGDVVWAMVSTRPLELDSGERISLVAIRDITQRLEAEEALRAMKDELEQRVLERTKALEHEVEVRREAERLALDASEVKSRLLANMSHELRTPLNAIIGYTEMLIEDGADLTDEEAEQDLGRILISSRHLLALVNDVLDLARIESGHEQLELERFHPKSLITELEQMVAPLAKQQQNQLIIENRYDGEVCLDQIKVKQILLNLLSNALKFTESGTVTLRFSPAMLAGTLHLEINVEDTGQGIAPEDLTHLFQPFVQSSSPSYAHKSGTGLGLAITKQYCEMMKGYIEVESTVGEGSRFTVLLPSALEPTSPKPQGGNP